jgi:hypothetical protein
MYYMLFKHSKIEPKGPLQPLIDERYIAVVLFFAQELARYVLGQANLQSVLSCKAVVTQLNGKMMELDLCEGSTTA